MAYFGRGKNIIKADYTVKDVYKFFDKKYNSRKISQTLFSKVFRELSTQIIDDVIFNNYEFTYPYRLGNLRVQRFKRKLELDEEGELITRKLNIDWKATTDLWNESEKDKEAKTLVYNFNEHSDGYNVFFRWDRRTCLAPNGSKYAFRVTRYHKRKLAKAIKELKVIHYG